jgi:polyisoprenoid-binding protein YceI
MNNIIRKQAVGFLLALLLSSVSYASEWKLVADLSEINFISTKKQHVSEIHQFDKFTGKLNDKGLFTLEIDLASVNTGIDIRNERMKEHLFDVKQFSSAVLSAEIDLNLLDAITEGTSQFMTVNAMLNLHGKSKALTLNIVVTGLADTKLSVTSVRPVIVNVNDFALFSGVEKLRELAQLPSISHTVPVSFYLTFNHD